MMIKPIAAVLIVALLVVGIIASVFIQCGYTIKVNSTTEVEIGIQEEAPVIHNYHITKNGIWGA
jgi:hypothetical protein